MFHYSQKNCNSQNIYQLKIENIRENIRDLTSPGIPQWTFDVISRPPSTSFSHLFNWNIYPLMHKNSFQGFPRHLL